VKLLQARAGDGAAWVRRTLVLFARQPFGFAALAGACMLAIALLGLLPLVGTVALLVLAPTGSLLFMIGARLAEGGVSPVPRAFAVLAAAGRQRLVPLLKLGLAYAAAMFFVLWLIGITDGGALAAFMESMRGADTSPEAVAARLADPRLRAGILLRLAFLALLSIPFWHAPGLVFWGDQSWAKALFFSTVALWRNKLAFLVYGLAWFGLWLLMLIVTGLVAAVVGPQRLAFIVFPLVLLFTTGFYVSVWFTFTGCFAEPGDAPGPAPAGA